MEERLHNLSELELNLLIKQNNDMISSCVLFEKGGNYDKPEIEWYQGQIDEINQMVETCKQQRAERVSELKSNIEALKVDP